ncbi:MAG: amino acid permease [Thermoguttaceae bacterium]
MSWKHLFAKKDLEMLLAEMAGEHRLHRVLGPVGLTSLGVGCIIGAGIFVVTGRAAALDAGPAVIVSFAIAAIGCALAALCYAEFAAMAPVAGSAYTYAYTTLGEIFAWIIGWDLILEYAMGCATVASAWSEYLNKFLLAVSNDRISIPARVLSDPFTPVEGLAGRPWLNLPSVLIMALVTTVLVLGIRESVKTNAILVMIKLFVVLVVVAVGWAYVQPAHWTDVPYWERVLPEAETQGLTKIVQKHLGQDTAAKTVDRLTKQLAASYRIEWAEKEAKRLRTDGRLTAEQAATMKAQVTKKAREDLPETKEDRTVVDELLPQIRTARETKAADSWGILGLLGLNRWLLPLDDATRSPFMPYGLSGIMLGASIVFFAFIGFDSISTHAEEARNPQRDAPIGILSSLLICTVLYILVAGVVTGMVRYPDIDIKAPIAAAFQDTAAAEKSTSLRWTTGLIAAGGLAGMTSVLLVLFLSQARVFMAMARDGLLPGIFGTVHPRFRTPHIATMVTGAVICLTAALTPIKKLEEMVNVGTLMAFVMVCAAVLILRRQRPDARRPFRCPAIWLLAPLGIVVNLTLMLFLPVDTWLRLVIWLLIGFVIYFSYSRHHSHLAKHLLHEIQVPRDESIDAENGPAPTVNV